MPGNLFTNYFLTEGIRATAEWRTSISNSTAFAAFRDGIRQRYSALSNSEGPNEAVTEQELIRPVLELLGWANYLPQQGTTRNEDIPDYLLFTDAASKERAAGRNIPEERFRDAIVVEESKRFGFSLDARDRDDERQSRTPHGQILRYLATADIESESRTAASGVSMTTVLAHVPPATLRPTSERCWSPAAKTGSASSTCFSVATHSPRSRGPRPASWKRR